MFRCAAFLLLFSVVQIAGAQRSFGYFLGDEIALQSEVSWDERFTLDAASVPQPGPVTYWLDLKTVHVTRLSAGRYRLQLFYQTFYAPLGAQSLEIPGYMLTASHMREQRVASVPPWRFLMSPLRDISLRERGDTVALQADIAPMPISLVPITAAASSFACVALLAGLAAAYHWARWPFARRGARPFTKARGTLRDTNYAGALLQLHRAFDESAGSRLLYEDLEEFLSRYPVFRPLGADIAEFFRASRQIFFGDDPAGAMQLFSSAQVQALVDRLAATERRT